MKPGVRFGSNTYESKIRDRINGIFRSEVGLGRRRHLNTCGHKGSHRGVGETFVGTECKTTITPSFSQT